MRFLHINLTVGFLLIQAGFVAAETRIFPQVCLGYGGQSNTTYSKTTYGGNILLGADYGKLFYGIKYSSLAEVYPLATDPYKNDDSNVENGNSAVDVLTGTHRNTLHTYWSLRSGLSYLHFTRRGALIGRRSSNCDAYGCDDYYTYERKDYHTVGIPLELTGAVKRKVFGLFATLGGNLNLYDPYAYLQLGLFAAWGKPKI